MLSGRRMKSGRMCRTDPLCFANANIKMPMEEAEQTRAFVARRDKPGA